MGHWICPADMYSVLAAELTMWSMACIAKLKVMNSHTGLAPAKAEPTAMPVKPACMGTGSQADREADKRDRQTDRGREAGCVAVVVCAARVCAETNMSGSVCARVLRLAAGVTSLSCRRGATGLSGAVSDAEPGGTAGAAAAARMVPWSSCSPQ